MKTVIRYELKKIVQNKLFIGALAVCFVAMTVMSAVALYEYSTGTRGSLPVPLMKGERPRTVFVSEKNIDEEPFMNEISLKWLINAYNNNTKQPFWTLNGKKLWIDQLSGTAELRKQIEAGWSEEQIKATWQKDLEEFKNVRAKYLIYEE